MNFLVYNICIILFTSGITSLPVTVINAFELPSFRETVISDSTGSKKFQLMFLPIIFSSPDTRLAIGVLPQAVFRTSSSDKPSSIRVDSYYTLNKQYHFLLRPDYWFYNDSWNINGKFSFKKWPTSYHGIGREAENTRLESFTETLYESSIEAVSLVKNGLYVGAAYSLRHGKISPDIEDGILASGSIRGSETTFISGIGTLIRYDTRNNYFYPESGSLHKFEIFTASGLLGSNYGFTRFTIDLRRYFPLHPSHVLAIQATGVSTIGSVPFRMLPSVGTILRGYSTVHHIDRNMIAIQAEYRLVPVFWRLGLTVFAGVSDVFGSFNEIGLNKLKYATGVGLRYQFSRKEKINIRADYGIGRKSSGDYIDINEAY
jgi:outer membrane protein assembly factor BamA